MRQCANVDDRLIVMTFKVLMVTPMVLLFEHLRLLVLSAQLHVGLYSTWWGSISNSPLVSCCLLYFVYVHLLGTLPWHNGSGTVKCIACIHLVKAGIACRDVYIITYVHTST